MKLRAIFLFVVIFVAPLAHGQTFRIATYNVNWGNRRGDQVLDAIASANADILCFQETTIQSEQFLRTRIADRYPKFHSAGHQGQYAAERFAFASKTRLQDVTFRPPRDGLFGYYMAIAQVGTLRVRLVNVHLTPFHIKPGAGFRDAIAALATTEDVHASEIDAVLNALDKEHATIILGDFNSISTMKAPQQLQRSGFVDSFAAVTNDADQHATWSWPTKPLPVSLRIDYIFHSRHFKTVKSDIIRREGSDHDLVVSQIQIAD